MTKSLEEIAALPDEPRRAALLATAELPQYPVLDLSDPRDDVPPPGEPPADPVAYAPS
jgi:hypothetical protein